MAERPRASSAHISPSAHYTGYVWYRHQLADPAFVTRFGRWAHGLLDPRVAQQRPQVAQRRVVECPQLRRVAGVERRLPDGVQRQVRAVLKKRLLKALDDALLLVGAGNIDAVG